MSNFKVNLNAFCEKKGWSLPHYDCSYPEDATGYIATVRVEGKLYSSTPQGNKRAAESLAAAQALRCLGEAVHAGVGVGGAPHSHTSGGGTGSSSFKPISGEDLHGSGHRYSRG